MVSREKLGVQSSLVKKGERDEENRVPFVFPSFLNLYKTGLSKGRHESNFHQGNHGINSIDGKGSRRPLSFQVIRSISEGDG